MLVDQEVTAGGPVASFTPVVNQSGVSIVPAESSSPVIMGMNSFTVLLEQCRILVASGFTPKGLTAEGAVAVILTGRELGLQAMQSLRGIYVVNGRPALVSGLIGALILKNGHDYRLISNSAKECTIAFHRKEWEVNRWDNYSYTIEEAALAALTGKDSWKNYPKDMLFNRVMAGGGRRYFPDVLFGIYSVEEMTSLEDVPLVIDPTTGEFIPGEAPTETAATKTPPPTWLLETGLEERVRQWFDLVCGQAEVTDLDFATMIKEVFGVEEFLDIRVSKGEFVERATEYVKSPKREPVQEAEFLVVDQEVSQTEKGNQECQS